MRIIVFGLYNSGSTAIAGALHNLGVNMGQPYFVDPDCNCFYESAEVAEQLRSWYGGDTITTDTCSHSVKLAFFEQWIAKQGQVFGVKHPLLCLCPEIIFRAFGAEAIYLWAYRPLQKSVAQLQARKWYVGHEERLQTKLYRSLQRYNQRLRVIDWEQLKGDPAKLVGDLIASCRLTPTKEQRQAAIDFIL